MERRSRSEERGSISSDWGGLKGKVVKGESV